MSQETYSVPEQAAGVFRTGILENPLVEKYLPPEITECAAAIRFEGSETPSIPIIWRFAESISALKALEASMLNVLLVRKYGISPPRVVINTDHAQLFFMSTLLFTIDSKGSALSLASLSSSEGREAFEKCFPSWDKGNAFRDPYRVAATNIYQTQDKRFFHLHGSLNPDHTLRSLGMPLEGKAASSDEAIQPFIQVVGQKTAEELDRLENEEYRQAGTICYTSEEYFNTEHGKANAHVGLYELKEIKNPSQAPCWWTANSQTSPKRPLGGLKVVDLTRIIAAPAISRGLAELGASVMRITCPRLPDYSLLHQDLNWGKWNACLDFALEDDRKKMRQLILEADVVVLGYRPGVLDKFGFDAGSIIRLCEGRDRGIVVVRENCYGWHGPWAGRSGWQQISDACCGVSMEFGRAMGYDEPVTPVFPNSDYCTGVIGTVGVLDSLLRRAKDGGSYMINAALNYYSQWLVRSCGTYSPDVWDDLWARNGNPKFRHYHTMGNMTPAFLGMMKKFHADKLLRPEFFEERHCRSIGYDIKTVKPVLQYPDGQVEPKYDKGTRTNGADRPCWPEDLTSEFVL